MTMRARRRTLWRLREAWLGRANGHGPSSNSSITPADLAEQAAHPDLGVASAELERAESRTAELEQKVATLSLQLEDAASKTAHAKESRDREIARLKERHDETLRAELDKVRAKSTDELEKRLREARAEWDESRAKWEAEQTNTRQKIKEAKSGPSKRAIEEALAKARKDWDKELADRLAGAEAKAAASLDQARTRWDAALVKAQEQWQAEEAARLAAAEEGWRQRSDKALDQAMERLKRAEAALAESKAEPKAQPGKDTELRRLRDTLAETQAILAERETALTDARYEIERVRGEALKKGGDKEIAAARKAWERELDGELARVRDEARAEGKAEGLAEGKKAGIAEGKAFGKAEGVEEGHAAGLAEGIEQGVEQGIERGRGQAKAEARAEAADSLKASRAAWQAEMDEKLEEAQKRQQTQIDAALASERRAWEESEQDRLSAAEAKWREKSSRALAEATARYQRAEAERDAARPESYEPREVEDSGELVRLREELADVQSALAEAKVAARAPEPIALQELDDSDELTRLREEVAAAQSALAEADSEFAQMRSKMRTELEKAKESNEDQITAAVREAEEAWKANERKRILAARVQWRKEARSQQARDAITKLAMTHRGKPKLQLLLGGGGVIATILIAVVLYSAVKALWWPSIVSDYVPPASHIEQHVK